MEMKIKEYSETFLLAKSQQLPYKQKNSLKLYK